MPGQRADASVYKTLEIESKVAQASPHQLVQMLFDEAHTALSRARAMHDEKGAIDENHEHVRKAMDIISYLHQSLSLEVDTDLPHNLASLYEYMVRQLLSYRMHNTPGLLTEVDALLETLSSAWRTIGETSAP